MSVHRDTRKNLYNVPSKIVCSTPKFNMLTIGLGMMKTQGSRRAWSWKVNRGDEGSAIVPYCLVEGLRVSIKGVRARYIFENLMLTCD